MIRSTIVAALLYIPAGIAAQEPPAAVLDALAARQTPFCWGAGSEPEISRDTVAYFPDLTVWVSRCEMYFGLPAIVAVAADPAGQIYLLDSAANVDLIQRRFGRPAIDSSNVVDYVLTVAKLQGAIDWDAVLVVDGSHPDPRRHAPLYPTDGDCDRARPPLVLAHSETIWDVYLDVAGASSIHRVSGLLVGTGFFDSGVTVERICVAMHAN